MEHRQRIGIFGGTFDPPHLGHLILAAEAAYQLHLNRLLFVLAADPPHKQGQPITAVRHRLDMLLATIGNDPFFELSRVDLDRPGPHYSLDTVRLLRMENPGAEMVFLMGGDSLHDLPTWHRPIDFVDVCDLIGVFRRPGDNVDLPALEEELPGLGMKVRFVETPLLEIASHDIRRRVAEGRPFRYFVPEAVYHIIRERDLYIVRE